MPVVAPKVKVVRVTDVPRGDPIIINPSTGQPYNRFGPYIDLGIQSVRDAVIYGRTRPLIPYANGRLIKAIGFTPVGSPISNPNNAWIMFATPNTVANYSLENVFGIAGFDTNGRLTVDTGGLVTLQKNTGIRNGGNPSDTPPDYSQIWDCGPLIFGIDPGYNFFLPISSWQPNTPYCTEDAILDVNGHIQEVQPPNGNGVSGSTLPIFDTSGGTTSDGTVTWFDNGLAPSGEVHAIAEVIEGVSPMPPYPATVEFIDPPTDIVAGATMPDVTVIVKDQYGNPYKFVPVAVDLLVFGANGSTFNSAGNRIDQTTGIATFSGLTTTDVGTYVLRAQTHPIVVADPIFSNPFNVT